MSICGTAAPFLNDAGHDVGLIGIHKVSGDGHPDDQPWIGKICLSSGSFCRCTAEWKIRFASNGRYTGHCDLVNWIWNVIKDIEDI
jgi:hypothetical protein